MPVNFGQLAGIPAPQVIASLPQQPSNQADTLAGGLMSGLLQGQQMQDNATVGQLHKLQLGQAQQEVQNQQQLKGLTGDAYADMKIQQGKADEALSYMTAQQQHQNAILQGKSSFLDLNVKQQAVADRNNTIQVKVVDAVTQIQDPIQRQAEMRKYKADLEKQYPGLELPDQYTDNWAASVMRTNAVIQSQKQQELTSEIATIAQAKAGLDRAQREKAIAQQKGQPTANIDLEIKAYEAKLKPKEDSESLSSTAKDAKLIASLEERQKQGTLTSVEEGTLQHLKETYKSRSAAGAQVDLNQANKLRDDFNQQTGDFRDVNSSYTRIKATAQDPSPAGDIALIFNYMKMLDPRSVVREGEYATAANAGSVSTQISALYNKVVSGERLTPEQRADFLKQSENLFKAQGASYEKQIKAYTERAKRAGLNPEDVITDVRNSESQTKTYKLNGNDFDMEAAKKATGLSEEEIIKQAGLK